MESVNEVDVVKSMVDMGEPVIVLGLVRDDVHGRELLGLASLWHPSIEKVLSEREAGELQRLLDRVSRLVLPVVMRSKVPIPSKGKQGSNRDLAWLENQRR